MRSHCDGRRNTAAAVFVGMLMAGITASALAQGSNCTTLGTQACTPTFSDVPSNYWAGCFINRVVQAGIMTSCGGDQFCPVGLVTRADMAVFLENAKHLGAPFQMAAATGHFDDVPKSFPLACWIEQLSNDGITAGCGTDLNPPYGPLYCPDNPVKREEMAIFILATKGVTPPACDAPGQPRFNDVPCSSIYAAWIGELAKRCIAAGCGNGNFCPGNNITREEMAVFLWAAFIRAPCTYPCTACATCS